MQDFPALSWLYDARNPTAIDWGVWPVSDGNEPRLIRELEARDMIAVVPREANPDWNKPRHELAACGPKMLTPYRGIHGGYNAVSRHVVTRWQLVRENDFFCLYRRGP
jgi:hypothetical protein